MEPQTPWRSRNFRFLFGSVALTNIGDGVFSVALAWLATLLTTNPFLIGLVSTARYLPWIVFALPSGVITDHFDHRRILLVADWVRVVLTLAMLTISLVADPGPLPIAVLSVLAFFMGCAEVLRDNTSQTFVPEVVADAKLERANGTLWTAEQIGGNFIGPSLAGLMIGLSVAVPFGAQAALLMAGSILTMAMRLPGRAAVKQSNPFLPAMRDGIFWLSRNAMLRRLALLNGAFNFFGFGCQAMFLLYCQRLFGLSALEFGLLLTFVAVGAVSATVVGPFLLQYIQPSAAIIIGMSTLTLYAFVLAIGAPLWVVSIVMVADGFAGILWDIAQVSYRQRHIPPTLLGRVNSAFRFVGEGPAAFGAIAFGALIAWAEPMLGFDSAMHLPFALAAFFCGLLTVYAAIRLRL